MKFWRDRDDVIPVRWFFTRDDAPFLPFPTIFNSRNWDAELREDPPAGEQGKPHPWRDGSPPPWAFDPLWPICFPPEHAPIFLQIVAVTSTLAVPVGLVGQVFELRWNAAFERYESDLIFDPNNPANPAGRLRVFRPGAGLLWHVHFVTTVFAHFAGVFMRQADNRIGPILGAVSMWQEGAIGETEGQGTADDGTCCRCGPITTYTTFADIGGGFFYPGGAEEWQFRLFWERPAVGPPPPPPPGEEGFLPPGFFPPGFVPPGYLP